jgi:hypothetical protein
MCAAPSESKVAVFCEGTWLGRLQPGDAQQTNTRTQTEEVRTDAEFLLIARKPSHRFDRRQT